MWPFDLFLNHFGAYSPYSLFTLWMLVHFESIYMDREWNSSLPSVDYFPPLSFASFPKLKWLGILCIQIVAYIIRSKVDPGALWIWIASSIALGGFPCSLIVSLSSELLATENNHGWWVYLSGFSPHRNFLWFLGDEAPNMIPKAMMEEHKTQTWLSMGASPYSSLPCGWRRGKSFSFSSFIVVVGCWPTVLLWFWAPFLGKVSKLPPPFCLVHHQFAQYLAERIT